MIIINPDMKSASESGELARSAITTSSEAFNSFYAFGVTAEAEELRRLSKFYKLHGALVHRVASAAENATPLCYINVPNVRRFTASSEAIDMTAAVVEGYRRVEERIAALASIEQEEGGVEKAATDTAVQVVGYLRQKNVAPPEVTSSGDDAVVMIWKMGEMTYAISVTDGELGFVVRQSRKTLKLVDSIRVSSFLLADMR